jgi:serine acetyltransferase
VIGPVHVGDHAQIGANAVVLCNVPEGHIAVGAPARILPRSDMAAADGCRRLDKVSRRDHLTTSLNRAANPPSSTHSSASATIRSAR